MPKPAVIKAEFTDYRPVKTRKVLQLVFEVPAESQTEVFAALGYPISGTSLWVAIAKLAEPLTTGAPAPERSEPRIYTRSQIAFLKLKDKDFLAWLVDTYWTGKEDVGDYDALLKRALGIKSKSELNTDGLASMEWDKMLASFDYRGRV